MLSVNKSHTHILVLNMLNKLQKKFILLCLCFVVACHSQNLTEKCNEDWQRYLNNSFEQWAMRMLDSYGKPEAGILDGNVRFEGNYEECVNVREDESNPDAIRGMYCSGSFRFALIPGTEIPLEMGFCIPHTCTDADSTIIFRTVNIFAATQNTSTSYCLRHQDISNDPGAIASVTIISVFAFLVAIATAFDVFYASKRYKTTNNQTSKNETKKTIPENVHNGSVHTETETKSENKSEPNEKLSAKALNGIENGVIITNGDVIQDSIIVNVITSGKIGANEHTNNGYDISSEDLKKYVSHEVSNEECDSETGSKYKLTVNEQQDLKPGKLASLLLAFSLYANIPRLMRAKHAPGSFTCLHGIRFISMAGVIWGHTYSEGTRYISNMVPTMDAMTTFMSEIFYQMWLIVDTFFLMSGFLVCYSLMKAIAKQGNKVSVKMMVMYYVHRYWRLTPVYMIAVMIQTNLLHHIVSGPQTDPEFLLKGDIYCKDSWWKNLLYIQNLGSPENVGWCFGHGWYLAIDMQLYIIAPVFIILTFYKPYIGVPFMLAGYCGSVVSNIVLYLELSKNDSFDHFVEIYIKPWTRANTYFIGMLLGFLMYKTKGKVKMNKLIVTLGWIVSIALIVISMYLPYDQTTGLPDECKFNFDHFGECNGWKTSGTTAWMSLISTMYVLGVSWIIFACTCGYGGFINSFLSWRAWIPLSRLSYSAYLIHISVLAIYLMDYPVQLYFSHYIWLYQFCGHIIITLALSFIMYLVFEIPMLGVEKVLLPHK